MQSAIHSALEIVERFEGPTAVVTVGQEKFFSNGLDLQYVGSNMDKMEEFLLSYMLLLHHVLSCPVPMVAAINGHCYAGGFLFAMAHDYRIMRKDRGFCCMNEIDLGMPLAPGMAAVARDKLPQATARDVVLVGKRFTPPEAFEAAIVDALAGADELLNLALALAKKLAPKGKNKHILGQLKQELYAQTLHLLKSGGLGFAQRAKL